MTDEREEFRETQQCLCFNMRRAARLMTRHYERYLRPVGLRATQFTLLSILLQGGPKPMQRLASQLGMERTTLTRNLRPLADRGWVKLEEGDDRRVHLVEITEEGMAAARRALPAWQQAHATAEPVLAKLGLPLAAGRG